MMRGPPGLPVTMKSLPSLTRMEGLMLESGRFFGAMAFEPRVSIRPYDVGGLSGALAKSSISLLRITPVPCAVMPEP